MVRSIAGGRSRAVPGDDACDVVDARRATLVLCVLYAVGLVILIDHGMRAQALLTLRYALVLASLCAVSSWIAKRAGSLNDGEIARAKTPVSAPLLVAAFVFVCVCGGIATVLDGPMYHTLPRLARVFIRVGAIRFALEAFVGIFLFKTLGLTNASIGLTRLRAGTGAMAVVWIGTVLTFVGIDLAAANATVGSEIDGALIHFFRSGVPEEFMFRGLLLALLAPLIRPAWANLVQALGFGMWHVGIDSQVSSGDPLAVVALMICVHAVFGYALGFVRLWSRSLAIPIVFHTIADNTGII